MKNKLLIISLLLVVIAPAAGLFADKPLRISVLYFDNTAGSEEYSWLEKGLADMLLTDLSLSEDIIGIEREELEKILSEQTFSLSGITDDGQSIEIGKLLAAQLLLTGSFVESGGRIRIDCKLLDTETGELRAAVKSEGKTDSIFELEAEIAQGVFDELGLEVPDGIETSKSTVISAAASYYRGLNLFDNGEYDRAVEFYRQASLIDPQYSKPRAGLEEAFKFLKDFRKLRHQREINKLLVKAEILRRRLKAKEWLTYADFIIDEYRGGNTDNNLLNEKAESLGLFSGESRAVCTWNLQNTLMETADLSREYFNDETMASYAESEIIALAREARTLYEGDAFLPEIIYQELLVTFFMDRWEETLVLCEELMLGYPEYRMMWAVEDFYEDALSNLDE